MASLRAVSLFSNCGAGDVGYRRAGFRFVVMAELDSQRLEIAKTNHPTTVTVAGDLVVTWPHVVSNYRRIAPNGRLDLLAACPPCQGMSSVRSGRGLETDPDAGSRDDRNLLVLPIARVASELKPRIIVVENVPTFLTRKVRHPGTSKPVSAAALLIDELRSDYVVFPMLADLADYGVPQTRKRAFLTFVRRDEKRLRLLQRNGLTPYPRPTHGPANPKRKHITLAAALMKMQLPSLDAAVLETARDIRRALHTVPVWDVRRYAMVRAIPPRGGASAWENDECASCGQTVGDEEASTCPICGSLLLRPIVVLDNKQPRLIKGFRNTSYRRMKADRPAATITTASGHIGSDYTIHPWENRVLSPQECAELQTFPRNFDWADAMKICGATNVRAMIGEAVPPRFTERHGRALLAVFRETSTRLLPQTDRRCTRAAGKLAESALSGRNKLPPID